MATRDHGLYRRLDTPAPDAAQGGCYITHDTGPCVDTGVLIFTEGTLTLGLRTILELAEVAGFSVNEEGEALEAENEHLKRELRVVQERNAELEDTLRGFAKAIAASEPK